MAWQLRRSCVTQRRANTGCIPDLCFLRRDGPIVETVFSPGVKRASSPKAPRRLGPMAQPYLAESRLVGFRRPSAGAEA